MVLIEYGKDADGNPKTFFIETRAAKTLDIARNRVIKKKWDYVAVISGLPGAGKSTLARTFAKYCDPSFPADCSRIAFTDEDFIRITNECPEYSAVVLDESFASLNTRISRSVEFSKIVNHLQLIRQKHLFIFLCLPNYFDLSKGIAIFRCSHLFVVYADEQGNRGSFMAFGRDEKRKLYVLGSRFMDYNCVKSNFYCRFTRNLGLVDDELYEKRKLEHLQSQEQRTTWREHSIELRDLVIWRLHKKYNLDVGELAGLFNLNYEVVQKLLRDCTETNVPYEFERKTPRQSISKSVLAIKS